MPEIDELADHFAIVHAHACYFRDKMQALAASGKYPSITADRFEIEMILGHDTWSVYHLRDKMFHKTYRIEVSER